MAVDDIDFLKQQLPEVFDQRPLPPGWDSDWLIIPLDLPESAEAFPGIEQLELDDDTSLDQAAKGRPGDVFVAPTIPRVPGGFPGAPAEGFSSPYPPPDALAFYLPFHYFFPVWWGIYLTLEGTVELARFLRRQTEGRLSVGEATVASRLFLYAHEAYHHAVECFGTRLEVSHRVPTYKAGFERLFQRTVGSDDCLEEALATAKGLQRVARAFKPPSRDLALGALTAYVKGCPPGYRRAPGFITGAPFRKGQNEFAEANAKESLSGLPAKAPDIWTVFPHAFSGIGRITSRVNYIVSRHSPLVARNRLELRFITYADLTRKLRERGCRSLGSGKGSHEMWEGAIGGKFPVPRHSGDLRTGTLAAIIKQAGLKISLEEFMRA